MVEADWITARQQAILTAIVETYIETGEPVGSGTIAGAVAQMQAASGMLVGAQIGLSPATVRNEMAALADAGLLEQPHTSAGRVPTAQALRMYVQRFGGVQSQQFELKEKIDSSFAGVAGTQALLERTSHVLAAVSSWVGLAVAAVEAGDRLEHVHFSRMARGRVLAVVVTQSGLVRDRMLALGEDLGTQELEMAAKFLNEHFRGWSIERVRAEIGRLVERERSEIQRLLRGVEELWAGAAPEQGAAATVYVDGVANLLGGTMAGSAEDIARLKEAMAALEAKQRLVELLNAYVDAQQEPIRVIFDLEAQVPELAGLVLVVAPTRMAGESRGTVGVIGPKRMHYENTMNAVRYTAQAFERMMGPNA